MPKESGDMESATLSVVVPMYNEEENVKYFVKRLVHVLEPLALEYEILLVDDGSNDGTWREIRAAAKEFPSLRGIRLARNFGHQAALLAGLHQAKGRAIVSMDGDMQHPPELIPALLKAWAGGAAVVSTLRTYNESTSFFKKATSSLYYRIFSFLSDVHMEAGQSDFRLIDRSVMKHLLSIQQSDLFLRGVVGWLNYPGVTIPFIAEDRRYGKSKYSLSKMFRFARSGILAFSTKPLQVGIMVGLMTSALSFLDLFYILVQYFRGHTVQGWASTLGLLSFLFGILFIMLGVVGTYLGRIYIMLQHRPKYVIDNRDDSIQPNPDSFLNHIKAHAANF